eukprot:UN02280
MSGNKKVLVKIIIIGESGVGKTALLHQYVTGNFIQEHKSTIGADFHTSELTIDNKTITLQIWDTAGQERFQSLGNAFYRGADACILVYDITDDNSFRQIEDWKTKFVSQAGIDTPLEYPFLLLANKTDLQNRAISQQQGQNYANENKMSFYETSALKGTNIEEAIKKIASIASDQPTVPFFHEEVVAKAMASYNNNNNDVDEAADSGGGCACLLL